MLALLISANAASKKPKFSKFLVNQITTWTVHI